MTTGCLIIETRPIDMQAIYDKHLPFIPAGWDVLHFNQVPINNAYDYNRLLTSADFWEYMPYDKVLIFQHDSQILRYGIEEFLTYDFIGAPLYHIPFPAMNGGFSLRSRDKMIEICKRFPWSPQLGNEDIYFCNNMAAVGGVLPDKETAAKFSVETIFGMGSFGVHAIDKWLTPCQQTLVLNQYK